MSRKKSFADDGWAIWVTGDDTSTLYLNEWVNPRGNNYVDVSVRIRGVKQTRDLNVYIPFLINASEIEDISFYLRDENIFRAIFSTRCIMDYLKNEYTSEIAYHGKTVDLIHFSKLEYEVKPLADGALITIPFDPVIECLDNDEAYIMFRIPHKNLDDVFKTQINMQNFFARLRDLVTSPVVSEKYSCSIRVNEARLLPEEINKMGAFHRQKLNKAVVTLAIDEDYQVNDSNCYRIHRMEKKLYGDYAPKGYDCDNAIIYEWNESREKNLYGHFNFFFGISRDSVSKVSMLLYMLVLLLVGLLGDVIASMLGM